MNRKLLWTSGIFTLSFVIVLFMYLFRTTTVDNKVLGVHYYKYRWGKLHSLTADVNRDGKPDFKGCTGNDGYDFRCSEFWEDRDFDGVFEIHAVHNHGEIELVEIDTDADGSYDKKLTGDNAKNFYAGLKPVVGYKSYVPSK